MDKTMSHHVVPLRVYLTVFIALMVLLALTIGAAFLHLGPFGLPVALTIAALKALLIVLYFMHLRYSDHVPWLFAGAGLFWLLILIVLTISDYVSRGWVPPTG
jgi:cytochrome c oxidase subunit 4